MRHQVGTLSLVMGLVVALATLAGCKETTTTTTSTAVTSSSTLAPVTSSSTSSTTQLTSTSGTLASTRTTGPAGYVPFPALVSQYGSLLEAPKLPGTLPYSVLEAGELASIFETLNPDQLKDMQGFRLANGDTVVLVAAPSVPSVEAFTSTCGGDGREIFTRFFDDFGYLVASKDKARTLRNMALVADQGQTLEGAISTVKAASGPYQVEQSRNG